jgi:hypothetical protein
LVAVLEAPWLAPVLRVSPIIVDGSLGNEHILPRLEKPEAQLNRTDLEADKGSLDLIALDDVLALRWQVEGNGSASDRISG